MDRKEAIARLKELEGEDLVKLARRFGVTIWKGGKLNKGWAGHTIERYLGLQLNSSRAPNFGSWELKVVPLKRLKKSGQIVPKETMAITMIDAVHVTQNPFEKSHLLSKLQKIVVCARMFESREEKSSILFKVASFDLEDAQLYEQIKRDYDQVRSVIITQGFDALTGEMGRLIQPRTKGRGHGSTTRAFYARKELIKEILGLPRNK